MTLRRLIVCAVVLVAVAVAILASAPAGASSDRHGVGGGVISVAP